MKKFILLIGIITASFSAFAGQSNDNYYINGSAVTAGASYTVSTSEIINYPYPSSSLFTDVKIEDFISVMIDHNSSVYQGTKLDYTFNIQIISWDEGLNLDSTTIQLKVEYDPTALTSFRDKHVYSFDGKVKVFTRIISITDNATGFPVSNPADIFMLRTDINIERYYPLNFAIPVAGVQAANTSGVVYQSDEGEYIINWASTIGAEEYDLEWTWVNTYTSSYGSHSISGKSYNFRNNSTRVRITGNEYRISDVFDKGALIFRVRAVGRNPNNFDKLLFGPWNIVDANLISSLSVTSNYTLTGGHELAMNWQLSCTFAEEGKKKEVISYFDGSLRSRQMVTRSNSTYDVLVAESFYDHQGRKALEALPVPVDRDAMAGNGGNKLEYYENFNKNTSLVKYSRADFDVDNGGACLSPSGEFSTTSGAARYYSSSNPEQSGFNAYLPEASGFPFIRTEFTPDNTGRVRRQGGVGPDHQLDGGHESKYFYGKPLQLELDRLFGAEAGYARFYKKDMVIDPNGQVSISYKDLGGKVVATALSGGNPGMVAALDSKDPALQTITPDLFEKDYEGNSQMNRINQDGDGLVFNTTLLVAENATYSFDYSVTAPAYIDGCMNPGICFDCVYDLTIRVIDDCGTIIGSRTKSVGLAEMDLTCASPQISYNSDDPSAFDIALTVGNYHIVKELTVNQEAFDFYLNALMDSTKGCFKTEAMFIAEEIANVDSSGCEMTCEECVAGLGTRDAFVLAGLGTEEDWQLAYDNCMGPCLEASKCQNLYLQMLSDMSPGGQYGEWFDTATGRMNSGAFPLSVLNVNNRLPLFVDTDPGNFGNDIDANWRNPRHPVYGTGYYYANGTRAAILLAEQADGTYLPEAFPTFTGSDGFEYAYPENLSTNKDFVFYWNNNWAKSLVMFHPEYCYYEWCEVNDEKTFSETSSEDFDNTLTSTESFSQALSLNLVAAGSTPNYLLLLDKDPYFATGGRGSSQYAAMNTILSSPYQGSTYSIFEMAAYAARCPGYYGTSAPPGSWGCFDFGQGTDQDILDQEWGALSGMYLAEKFKLQQEAAHDFAQNNCVKGLNGCIGEKDYTPAMDGLSTWTSPDLHKPSSPNRYFLYASKTRRFLLERDLTLSEGNVEFDMYYKSGKCPEAFYLESFLGRVCSDGDLLNTFGLRNKPYFVEQIYSKINGGLGLTYVDYDYTPSIVTGTYVDILKIQFFDQVPAASACEINIALPNGYAWSMVTRMENLTAFPNTSDPNQFKITAYLDDDADPVTPDIELDLVGTSCFTVSGCEFEYQCDASQYALDLMSLMNRLVEAPGNALLSTSNVALNGANYVDYLTVNIKNYTPIFSGHAWLYNNSTHKFYLKSTDIAQTGYAEFDFIAYDPGSFTDLDLSKIEYFASIKPDPLDATRFFMVVYYDDDANSSTPPVPLTIQVQSYYSNGGYGSYSIFGNCHLPVPTYCQSPEHLTKNDLEPFLNAIVVNPPVSTVDLNDLPLWTSYMQGQLGVGSYRLGAPEVYFDSMVFDIISDEISVGAYESICRLKIFRINSYYNDRYDFDDIVELKDIRVNSGLLIDGKAYAFTLTAVHANGVEEIIGGSTSCLPIKDCGCEAQGFGGGEGSSGDLDCDGLYAAYLETIHLFNENEYLNNPGHTFDITPLSREEFDCSCMINYVMYLRTWDGISPLKTYAEVCDEPAGCSDNFQAYVEAVNDWNANNPGHEIDVEAVNGELCGCFTAYIKYLKNFSQPTQTPLTIIEFSGGNPGDPNYCDEDYDDGEGCIEKLENVKRAHIDFANSTSRNPNGYQFYGLTGPESDPANCDCLDAYAAYLDGLSQSVGDPAPQSFADFISSGGCGGGSMLLKTGGSSTQNTGGVRGNDAKKGKENFGEELMSMASPEETILQNSSIYTPLYGPGWSCGKTIQFTSDRFGYYSRCGEHLIEVAVNNGKIRYQRYLDSLQGAFKANYNQHCLSALEETFTASFSERTYHYTLYYYDQAGNLIRTVPPAGVVQLTTSAQFDSVNYDRTFNKRKFFTKHTLVTKYEYNSLNQLIKQSVPDHDFMNRWYVNASAVGGELPPTFVATTSYAVDASTTIIAGMLSGEAVIYRSDDAGKNWYRFGNILASDLLAISMANTSDGFAVGKDGLLYQTADGGSSWSIHPHTLGLGEHLNAVHFKDASNGVVIGENGTCYYTSNGGATWSPSATGFSGSLTTLTAQSTSVLYLTENISGNALVYKSTDFGANWTAAANYIANDITDVHMLNASEGFAAGKSGTFLHTTDGGANWFLVAAGISMDFRTIYFRDASKGFAILETSGDGGNIYKTDDGGQTWVQASTIGTYRSFSFYSTDEGYAVGANGGNGILAHLNANTGAVAKQANNAAMTGINLYAVHFNTVDEGYVAGDGGNYLLSTNASSGLAVWTNVATGYAAQDFRDMYFRSATEGALLSATGKIIVKNGAVFNMPYNSSGEFFTDLEENAGYMFASDKHSYGYIKRTPTNSSLFSLSSYITYTPTENPNNDALRTVATISGSTAIVAGDAGILLSNSSIQTKNIEPLPLQAISAVSGGSNVFAVGDDGDFWISTDAGTNWKLQSTNTASNLKAVDFVSATAGMIGGESGTVLRYASGTLISSTLASSNTVFDIDYLNTSDVALCGANGLIQKSLDGGANWSSAGNTGVATDLFALDYVASGEINVVGELGLVWKSDASVITRITDFRFPELTDIHFVNEKLGIMSGDKGTLLRSENGGATWLLIPAPNKGQDKLNAAWRKSNDEWFISDETGDILRTDDLGLNYNAPATTPQPINDLAFDGENAAVAVGDNGTVWFSADAGLTWGPATLGTPTSAKLRSVQMINQRGYLAGDNGTFMSSDDWGQNWTTYATGTVENLHQVYFYDYYIGYVIGENGTLRKSVEGGDNWAAKDNNINGTTNTTQDLYTMAFNHRFNGIFAGDDYQRRLEDEADLFSGFFYYDKLGRLTISENTKQFNKTNFSYSYTLFDYKGRITEVGEMNQNADVRTLIKDRQIDDAALLSWISASNTRLEVTSTQYDVPLASVSISGFTQDNTRKRVASVFYEEVYDGSASTYTNAIHYTYDIHGNVSSLIQDNPMLSAFGRQYVRMDYSYDLVSGNVNEFSYQPGERDQWHHRYTYDADNRITEVQTSLDNIIWDVDARYEYYRHGPLARTETGDIQVQGSDFAYTLQGWLKGVNSMTLTANEDMGADGASAPGFAKDAFGFILGYHDNDYSSINTMSPGPGHFVPYTTGSDLEANRSNFYNGNISMMVTTIKDPTTGSVLPQGYAYQYDQLNRLAQMRAFSNYNLVNNEFQIGGGIPVAYGENFTYDANGNILTLDRSGVAANPNMDNLTYQYDYYNNNPAEGLRSNRLYHVNDGISSTGYDDIQDQGLFTPENQATTPKEVNTQNNYGYDELGNLVRDDQEEIANITWTVSGKIKSVTRSGGSTLPNLEFVYDPMGNRIAKIETLNPYDPNGVNTTYYGRDVHGTHLVTYDHHINDSTGYEHLLLDERIMYGINRLGLQDYNDSIWGFEEEPPVLSYYERNLGRKKYEGTNHLGNVLAVYSDKRIPKDNITPGGPIDYYEADIHGAYDYYSFGSSMPERTFVPQACSTQNVILSAYTYQDNFTAPVPLWLPMNTANVNWGGPNNMMVNCNAPADGAQQTLPCVGGVTNVLDLTISYGQNDIQIMLLDPLTMLPLPGYPILYPAMPPGTVQNIQLFFVGPPSGNVLVQINSPGGPFPFPDMFSIQYAAISTQTTVPTQVCWDEDYRFGFNGMEKDNEAKGQGNHYDFGLRNYDARLGRMFSIDPRRMEYPWQSTYVYHRNCPILIVDYLGGGDGEKEVENSVNVSGQQISSGTKIDDATSGLDAFEQINEVVKKKTGQDLNDTEDGAANTLSGNLSDHMQGETAKKNTHLEFDNCLVCNDDEVDVNLKSIEYQGEAVLTGFTVVTRSGSTTTSEEITYERAVELGLVLKGGAKGTANGVPVEGGAEGSVGTTSSTTVTNKTVVQNGTSYELTGYVYSVTVKHTYEVVFDADGLFDWNSKTFTTSVTSKNAQIVTTNPLKANE